MIDVCIVTPNLYNFVSHGIYEDGEYTAGIQDNLEGRGRKTYACKGSYICIFANHNKPHLIECNYECCLPHG